MNNLQQMSVTGDQVIGNVGNSENIRPEADCDRKSDGGLKFTMVAY